MRGVSSCQLALLLSEEWRAAGLTPSYVQRISLAFGVRHHPFDVHGRGMFAAIDD